MLTLVASMLLSLPAIPSASVTCADEPASCDSAWRAAGVTPAGDGPVGYATPAEVDCRMPAAIGQIFSDACDQAPPDLWYRVSREPDTGAVVTLSAARREVASRAASSCGGQPVDPQPASPSFDAQPLALIAVPALAAGATDADFSPDTQAGPDRGLVPLDRPPRA